MTEWIRASKVYFRVKFPDDWPVEMRYEFDWQKLKDESDPYYLIDYSKIA